MSRRLFTPRAFSDRQQPVCSRAGFTIVELLVAAAITLVVLGLMLQITFTVLGTFGKVSGSLTARAEATTALDYLREDFQSLVWRRDGNVWLLATIQVDQTGTGDAGLGDTEWSPAEPKPGKANPGENFSSLRLDAPGSVAGRWQDLSEYRFGQAGVWLRFFTNRSILTSDGDAAPIAVAYQIMRIPPRGDSGERYQLFRSITRSGRENLANAYSVADAGYNLATNDTGAYNRPGTPISDENDEIGDPGSIRRPNRNAIIANNVIDFGVRFWRSVPPPPGAPAGSSSELQMIFPATANGRPDENNLGFAVTAVDAASIVGDADGSLPAPAQMTTGFPDFVDVFIRVLTDEGARLIEAFEEGNVIAPAAGAGGPTANERKAYWWKIAEENSEVFTERIPLNARPF